MTVAMQVLRLLEGADSLIAVVHLDTSKLVNNVPDPLYVARHQFPLQGEGLTGQAYLDWVQSETLVRSERQLTELQRALPLLPSPDPGPLPVRYSGTLTIDARVRTTTANATEIYRAPLAQVTIYRARLELLGVDAGNANAKYMEARVVAKRLAAGGLLVGAPVVLTNLADAGASTWTVAAAVSGNDFIVTVTGAAGRTIDWQLAGDVVSFTPGGA